MKSSSIALILSLLAISALCDDPKLIELKSSSKTADLDWTSTKFSVAGENDQVKKYTFFYEQNIT